MNFFLPLDLLSHTYTILKICHQSHKNIDIYIYEKLSQIHYTYKSIHLQFIPLWHTITSHSKLMIIWVPLFITIVLTILLLLLFLLYHLCINSRVISNAHIFIRRMEHWEGLTFEYRKLGMEEVWRKEEL